MEQVKDQQRLFEKLFVSPNSDSHSGLILSMQFLKLLLDESQQLTLAAQRTLLFQLLRLFQQQPINSLLLYKHDENFSDQTPLLCSLVQGLARVVRTHQDIAQLLPLLNPLFSYYPVSLLHVTSITRELSIQFHMGSFNPIRTKFYHSVLEKYYGRKSSLENEPWNYFFFFAPNQNSIIHSPQNTKISIKNQLSIFISFKTLKSIQTTNIIWIATNHQSLAVKIGKKIKIQNQSTGVELSDNEQIKAGIWYWLLVNTTTSETSVYLNGEEIIREKRGLLKKEKQRQIREYAIGQGFAGFLGGVLLLDKVASVEAFKDFTSLKRWKQVIALTDNKLHSSVALSCLPYAIFEMRESSNCFDIFRKSHSIIGENIAIYSNPLSTGIAFLGSYDVLLPLFYLARFYNAKEYPQQLHNILKIWLVALETYKDPENLEQFMIIIGHHLESLPCLLSEDCVNVLSQIYQRLSAGNKVRFLRHVGWSGLPGRSQGPGVKAWLNWLTKLYQNYKSECLRSYGLMDVAFWLVKYLQNNEQHCCPEHYINEARALRQFDFQQLRKIEDSTKKSHFEAVENIAAVILEYAIIDHPDQAVKSVKSVLRLLLHKYSNCLYFTILKILKRQVPKFRNDKDVSQIMLSANILPFLAALAQKVVDHSLLSLILYLMLLVSQFSQESRREVVDFFCIVYRRLKDIHQQHFNLLSHGARKVRKRSLDDFSIIEKHQKMLENSPTKSQRQISQTVPVSKLMDRLRHYRSNFGQMKYLLLNCCFGVVDDVQLTKQTKLVDEKAFTLLRNFLPLADKQLTQQILTMLLSKIKENPNNNQFCQNSRQFTKLLLQVISEEPSLQILTEIIQSQLKRKIHLGDYYIHLKNFSRSQIKMIDVLCDVFSRLFKRQFKFSLTQLYQILLIMTNQLKNQEEPQDYWLLLSAITRNISHIIKLHLLTKGVLNTQVNGLEIIERMKNLKSDVLEGVHFQLQLNNVNEQQVNFLFDIILPKLIAGCNVSHLLLDIKRPIYIFEIYLFQLMETVRKKGHIKGQFVNYVVEAIIAFISVAVIRPEEETNKSFMRMVLFFANHFLLSIQEDQSVLIIWNFIISFVRKAAEQYDCSTYPQLREALIKANIQPFLVEIFQIFLRTNNQDYLITFQTLLQASDGEGVNIVIREKLLPILKKEEFAQIFQACKKNALQQLYLQYQEKIMNQQARLDLQGKPKNDHTLFQAVQKIFEQESIGEEETRLKYLHEHQNYLRQYHSTWNELWKRMRIYHHPYGIFNAQKDSPSHFTFPSEKFKNFRFKMSKYSSASGIQPILEADILQPWHVRKLMQQQSKNEVNNLVQLMRPNQAKPKTNGGVIDTFANFLKRISGQKGRKYTEYEVLWVKQGRKARGKLTITDRDQIVFWYESLKQEDSHLAFQRFSLLFNEPMVRSWRLDYIRKVQERRYLMKYNAIEIVLLSRKSLLFYFQDHRNQEFLQELQRIRNTKLQMMAAKLKLNKVPFYLDDWYQEGLSAKITEDWRNRKISNMEYLMAVNRAASRGIYDISQYPVFPWVCEMKQEKQPTMRDLTKTMGGLGSQQRKKIVTEKYIAADPFNPVPAFHFGTHYSSPGVVFNFLIRLAPFTDYCKNLQGGKFDIPDRLFSSLVQAWRSASSQVSDVRELIPEFYYLPESLLNCERLHLGQTQSGEIVDHVELPPWAASNPYFFIAQMRQMLESQQCSVAVGQWLDLLFGVKQKGPAAKDNFNVYYYLTYEDYSNCLSDTTDDVYRKSCEAQIVHFGQIPPQIFQKEHPKRVPRKQQGPVQLRITERVTLMNNLKEKVIGAHRQGNQLILIKRNIIQVLALAKSPAVLTRASEFNFQRTLSKQFIGIKKEQAKVVFFRQQFIVYGYITNQFRIFNRVSGALQFDDSLTSKIECVLVSEDQSLILLGCKLGTLFIYEIQYDSNKLSAKRVYSESFLHSISHISERDGFFAISFGCFVSIYKFERSLHYLSKDSAKPFVRFFRSFHNALPVRGAYIADTPLYSLVIYDKANVRVYSINGQLLKVLSCSPKKLHALRDRDLNSLFCVQQQGRLLLLSTPDLRCISELQISGALQVVGEMVIYERAIHFIGC